MPTTIEVLELLTVQECAVEFGVKERRVQQFIELDRLQASKIGGRWFVTREEVERFKIIPRKSGNFTGRPRVASGKTRMSKFGGWGAYPGERSHSWTWSSGGDPNVKDFRWRTFCGIASDFTEPNTEAPFKKPFPKRAGKCYACFYFAKL